MRISKRLFLFPVLLVFSIMLIRIAYAGWTIAENHHCVSVSLDNCVVECGYPLGISNCGGMKLTGDYCSEYEPDYCYKTDALQESADVCYFLVYEECNHETTPSYYSETFKQDNDCDFLQNPEWPQGHGHCQGSGCDCDDWESMGIYPCSDYHCQNS